MSLEGTLAAPAAIRPRAGGKDHAYIPEIDGLRAVAVLSVMIYHLRAAWLPGGFCGVDVFFVISGYVVTLSLRRDADAVGGGAGLGPFLLGFYARRVLRIVPALLVCLLAATALTVLFVPRSWLSETISQTALYAFLGASNLALLRADSYFAPRAEFNPFTHTWSLGVEEQFYAAFPLLLFIAWRARRHAGAALALTGGATLLSFGFLAAIGRSHPDLAFFWLPSRFWELGVGASLALAHGWRCPAPAARAGLGLALVGVSLAWADRASFPFPWALPAVAGSALLLPAVCSGGAGLPARLLRGRPMVFVGRISYALYLWHWVVYTLLRWTTGLASAPAMAVAVVASLGLAWTSTTALELPIRRGRRIASLPRHRVVLLGVAALALGGTAAGAAFDQRDRLSLSRVGREGAAWFPDLTVPAVTEAGCKLRRGDAELPGAGHRITLRLDCPAPRRRQLFVAGDSHALAYTPALHRLTVEESVPLIRYLRTGCPVASLIRPATPTCAPFVRSSMEDIARSAMPGDVVLLASLRMTRLAEQTGPIPPEEIARRTTGPEADAAAAAALAEADEIVGRLQAAGLVVVIDAPKPVFRAPAFRCLDWFNRDNPACAAGLTIPRDGLLPYLRPVRDRIAALAARHPGLIVWDAFDLLCPGPVCAETTPDGPLFSDGDHITAHADDLLYPSLRALLLPLLTRGTE